MSLGGRKKRTTGKLGKKGPRVGDRLEREVESDLSGLKARRTPGSGNYAGRPADLDIPVSESFLLELKEITGRRVSAVEITKWLRKITREARTSGRKIPGLVVGFPDMEGAVAKKWIMFPLDKFENLVQAAGWEALEDE
jgi:hypothetical protein